MNKPTRTTAPRNPDVRLIRREEVERRCAISTSKLYKLMRQGAFPKQVPLDNGRVRWVEEEVSAWIAARIAARDEGEEADHAA